MPSSVSGISETMREIEGIITRTRTAVLERLCKVGEEAVKIQRRDHGYKDQTGNLTSSIGYVVLDHGAVYRSSSFAPTPVKPDKEKGIKGGSGKDGSKVGRDLVSLLAQKYATDDIALIVVAGMEYAEYVEAMALNVIDSANAYVLGNAEAQVKKAVEAGLKAIQKKLR